MLVRMTTVGKRRLGTVVHNCAKCRMIYQNSFKRDLAVNFNKVITKDLTTP